MLELRPGKRRRRSTMTRHSTTLRLERARRIADAAWYAATAAAMIFLLPSGSAHAGTAYCTQTADTLFSACKATANGDSLVRKAVCLNLTNAAERKTCQDDSAD